MPNQNNIHLCKNLINDFLALINFLIDKRKEVVNKDYSEELKLFDVILQLKDSNFLFKLFEDNEILTINKTIGIFDFTLLY